MLSQRFQHLAETQQAIADRALGALQSNVAQIESDIQRERNACEESINVIRQSASLALPTLEQAIKDEVDNR